MSQNQNPFQLVLKACEHLAHSLQIHLSHFISPTPPPSPSSNSNNINGHPQFSLSSSSYTITTLTKTKTVPATNKVTKSANPVTKEELGRATWMLLHTLAAQLPERPTRQQKKDVKELMAILSRLYPCRECADHFKDVLRANPVQAGSQAEFSQWLCHVHNVVNRSLGKLAFPCQRIDARWGKLECLERACDLEGASTEYRRS